MRETIIKRLANTQEAALKSIEIASNKTRGEATQAGAFGSSRMYLQIDEDIKNGVGSYVDQSAKFISHVAGQDYNSYGDELRLAAITLKNKIIEKQQFDYQTARAFPGNATRSEQLKRLGPALNEIIAQRLEDFSLGIIAGEKMEHKQPTIQNTVNISDANITNSVITILQSGKGVVIKEIAQKVEEIAKSAEIGALDADERQEALDHAEIVISELNKTSPDEGKVRRALNRFGSFLKTAGVETAAKAVAELAVATAKMYGVG